MVFFRLTDIMVSPPKLRLIRSASEEFAVLIARRNPTAKSVAVARESYNGVRQFAEVDPWCITASIFHIHNK